MHSLLNQLQSDEALLMMYVAGELSAEDRARVEQRLADDAGLRAELERVRELNGFVDESLAGLDVGARLPVSEGVAVRKVGRVMRQWQTDRMAPHEPEEPADQLRFPWWSYPLTTAAAILIAFLVWWGQQDGPPEPRPQRITYNNTGGPDGIQRPYFVDWDDILARRLWRSIGSGYEPEGLQTTYETFELTTDRELDEVDAIFMTVPVESERTG